MALLFILSIYLVRRLGAFRPLSCRLYPDNINVYAMSIHFKFEAVQQIDTLTLQCSRLLNQRDFASFSTQNYPLQDVEVMKTNAQGTNQLVVSSLSKGTLYHCRCISENAAHQYRFKSPILSTSTKKDVLLPPILSSTLRLIKSADDKSVQLKWNPLAQDVNQLAIQISNKIPPNWKQHETKVEGDVAALFEYEIGITDLNDGEAYSIRIVFANKKGSGHSNVLSFVVPVLYLESVDVRAASDVEMSEMTPQFHRKIYSYAVMVAQNCETIEFGITPLDNVIKINAKSITNGSAEINTITDAENEELVENEASDNTIDMSINNVNVLKSDEEIEEEFEARADENEEVQDERLGMDNSIAAETQSFDLDAPGLATEFTIESGSNIRYQILVIRAEEEFGVPKYQMFDPPAPVPCPKQKRIVIRYGSFWVYYKEYIIGFLVFVFMIFVRMYERSTRIKMDDLLTDQLVPE
eukprot:957704_1